MSNMPCFTTPKQFYDTCHSHHRIGTSRKGNLSSFTKNNFEAKSLQLALTACWLAPIALNIWSYLRLPDACYLVVDLPYQRGTFTRWNYRPCSAAHPLILLDDFGNSSVNYQVWVWIEDPWDLRVIKSQLNEAIWWGLKEAGILKNADFDKN